MLSLSLAQQCFSPVTWPVFMSRTNDHTAQCLTHGDAFLKLYDYHCNKSCWGTCFSRGVPLITWQQYISTRDVLPRNPFSLTNLVPKLSQDVYLGKGSGKRKALITLRLFFLSILSSQMRSI